MGEGFSSQNTILKGVFFLTYKYSEIRREMFVESPDKILKKKRSFIDIKKQFTIFHWAILFFLVVSAVICVVLGLKYSDKPFLLLIPIVIIFGCAILIEFFSDKMYNPLGRNEELKKQDEQYGKYIDKIHDVLNKHGINSAKKRALLKKECEDNLIRHEEKFKIINGKTFEILIGVPLGALISSLIYKNDDALIGQIIGIIILGIFLVLLLRIIKRIIYFSDGYFKDKYLMDILNEFEYSAKDKD